MPAKIKKTGQKFLSRIEKSLTLSLESMEKIMKDFHLEMARGIEGQKSSLKMLPTYVDSPTGKERGRFIALDLGGTNLRILLVELKGRGKIAKLSERKFVLEKKYMKGSGRELFGFIAGRVKDFIDKERSLMPQSRNIGFTFSFPVKQTGIACGTLIHWTKGFSAGGVVGKDVVSLLNDALAGRGIGHVRVEALVNDTVGTLASCSYKDPHCDIGVILGTGTNACYREESEQMLVNIEWGNFNKLHSTVYDKLLDRNSNNPGRHILEKMVSGMYLGELAGIIINDLAKENIAPKNFKTEYMSQIENDSTADLSVTNRLLQKSGIRKSDLKERLLVKGICRLVAKRASCISAAALAGVITRIDPFLSHRHTVAVDGTVYEKYPGFSENIKLNLRRIFGEKSQNIKLVLTKDGSGIGAAIVTAVAVKRFHA